jgi:hypothetical protein
MVEMTPARRRVALAFVAIGIGLIVQRTIASGGDGDADVVAPVAPGAHADGAEPAAATSAPRAVGASTTLRLDRLGRRARPPEAPRAASDPPLFAVQSWQPPPPPAPPPRGPVEPQAPPFPYTYMGGLTDDNGRTAFFNRGDRVLNVRVGDTVDGRFRVDHLDESSMTVTYVPLNQSAQVALGGGR